MLMSNSRDQEMDHQWDILVVLCHGGQDSEGLLDAPD